MARRGGWLVLDARRPPKALVTELLESLLGGTPRSRAARRAPQGGERT
jgi:hypothetical protein